MSNLDKKIFGSKYPIKMTLEEHLKMTLEEHLKTLKDRLEKLTPISEEKEPIKEIIVGEMFTDDNEPCYEIEVNGI